jgi:PAS domain S-box-containing protein
MTDNRELRILIGWKEIASYLNCSTSTAIRRLSDGLPVFRVGGGVRAFADDIDRWLEGERLQKLETASEAEAYSPGIVVDGAKLVEAASALTRDKKGLRYALIPIGIDTSEYERIEDRLKQSEEQYRWLVETVPAWIWETDADGKLTYSNVAAIDILGYRPEELVGFQPSEFLVSPKDRARYTEAMAEVRSKRKVVRGLECRFIHREASEIWLETDGEPVFDGRGHFVGVRAVSRDVTERRRAEEALRESEEKYRSLAANIPVGVFRAGADADGEILSANPAFARMFGYDEPADVMGRKVADLYAEPGARAQFIGAVTVRGAVQNYIARLKRRSRDEFWASISARAVKLAGGAVAHLDGVVEDITERREAEKKIRDQNRFLNTVLASLAHSFYVINAADYKVLLANPAAMSAGVIEASLPPSRRGALAPTGDR